MNNRAKLSSLACLVLAFFSGCDSNKPDLLMPEYNLSATVARVDLTYDTAYFLADTAQLHSFTQSISLTAKAYDVNDVEVVGVRFNWNVPNAAVVAFTPDTALATSGNATVAAAGNGKIKVVANVGTHRDSIWVHVDQVAKVLQVTPTEALMGTGSTIQLTAAASDSLGQPQHVGFRAGGTAATVDEHGLVSAVSVGKSNIRVNASPLRIEVPIQVRSSPLVDTLSISPSNDTLNSIGMKDTLAATVLDTAGNVMSGVTVTWASSRPNIATITSEGIITTVARGNTRITATAGGVSTTSMVYVQQDAQSLTINGLPSTMLVGDNVTASCSMVDSIGSPVLPGGCRWHSSDTNVLTVNSDTTVDPGHGAPDGFVEAKSPGAVDVIAERGGYNGFALVADTEHVTVIGTVDHFVVEASAGGNIGTQTKSVAFNVKITAQDAANNTSTTFAGTVTLAYEGDASGSLGTSGSFTAGVLSSQSITIPVTGNLAVRATAGGKTGVSNTFPVVSAPVANNDSVSTNSTPGSAFHTAFNTTLTTTDGSAQDLQTNDQLGFPAATISSFGAIQTNDGTGTFNSASGTVTSNAAGTTVSPLPGYSSGSLTVNSNGTLTLVPPTDYTGLLRFQYRLTNTGGTADGTVTLAVGERPSASADSYSGTLIGNLSLNTATSGFSVLSNDAGSNITLIAGTNTGGTFNLNSNGTFAYVPTAAFSGTASLAYSVRNGFGSSSATASMTVGTTRVWFVDGSVTSSGTGTQASPFKNISDLASVNNGAAGHPAANDIIYVAQNASAYTGALTLLSGQRVYGQDAVNGADPTLRGVAGLTVPADQSTPSLLPGDGTPVTLTTSSGNTITLGSGNTLRGFTLGSSSSAALSGTNFGTLTVGSDVVINTNVQAISLGTGTISGNLGGVTSTGGANNIWLSAVSGTSDFSGGALSGASANAIMLNGAAAITYSGTITDASSSANVVLSGTGSLALSGNVTRTSGTGPLVSVSAHSGGTLTMTGQVTTSSGNGLTFDNADGTYNLSGVAASSTLSGGSGIALTTNSDGVFTFGSNMSIAAGALDVNGGTPALVFNGSITNNNGRAVSVQSITGDSVVVAGNITSGTSGAPTGKGIVVQNNSGGLIRFRGASKSLYTSADTAVALRSNTGATVDFPNGGLAINTTTGRGFRAVGGGTLSVSGSSNTVSITGAAESGLWLTGMTVGSNGVAFSSVASSGTSTGSPVCLETLSGSGVNISSASIAGTSAGPGICLTSNSAPVTIGSVTIDNSASAGIQMTSNTGAVAINGGTIGSSNDPTGNDIDVSGGNTDITVAASLTKTTSGKIVNIASHSGGTINFTGALNCSTSCTGLSAAGNTGGVYSFTNTTKSFNTGSSTAVALSTNTGSTFTFSNGGLNITSTSGDGLNVTGGGTLNVSGTGNIISTDAGTALKVQNTTIGSTLTFQSISAGASGGSGNNGIFLDNTGGTAGLTVTGNSSGHCGGWPAPSPSSAAPYGTRTAPVPSDCTGGTIQARTGSDGTTNGTGIYLSSTRDINLTRLRVTGTQQNYCIYAKSVTNVTMYNVLVDGTCGTVTTDTAGIRFSNLSGSASIKSSAFSGGAFGDDFDVYNNAGGTLNRIVFDSVTFGTTTPSTLNSTNLDIRTAGNGGTLNATVQNSRFIGARGTMLGFFQQFGATGDLIATNNVMMNGVASGSQVSGNTGLNIAAGATTTDNSTTTYTVTGNRIGGQLGVAFGAQQGSGTGNMTGTFSNNYIGDAAVANSGSRQGNAIYIDVANQGKHKVQINNNNIQQYNGFRGIYLLAGGNGNGTRNGSLHVTMNGNTVGAPGNATGNWVDGIGMDNGTNSGDNYTICLSVGQSSANNIASAHRTATDGSAVVGEPFDFVANLFGNPNVVYFKLLGYPAVTNSGDTADTNLYNTIVNKNGGTVYTEVPNATSTYSTNNGTGANCDLF